MDNWFVTWFNTTYYHILYKDRNVEEAARFIDTLISYLNVPKASKVLDLACGKGRHSLQLHQRGFDVVGMDLSDESIEQARANERNGLEFYVHDMRSLYWHEYFDLVVNLFTSFGYFHSSEDDQQTISSVADALKPEGIFVIDFMNAVKVEENLIAYEEKELESVRFELNRNVENGVIVKKIHVTDGEIDLDFEERVDALKLEHFKTYFEKSGLTLEATFGDYELNPFEERTSDRLIMITKKNRM